MRNTGKRTMRYTNIVANGSALASVPAGKSVTNPSGMGVSNAANTSRTTSPARARTRSESVHQKRICPSYNTTISAATGSNSWVSGASRALGLGGGGTTLGIPHV